MNNLLWIVVLLIVFSAIVYICTIMPREKLNWTTYLLVFSLAIFGTVVVAVHPWWPEISASEITDPTLRKLAVTADLISKSEKESKPLEEELSQAADAFEGAKTPAEKAAAKARINAASSKLEQLRLDLERQEKAAGIKLPDRGKGWNSKEENKKALKRFLQIPATSKSSGYPYGNPPADFDPWMAFFFHRYVPDQSLRPGRVKISTETPYGHILPIDNDHYMIEIDQKWKLVEKQ